MHEFKTLNAIQWYILAGLADGDEPFEAVDGNLKAIGKAIGKEFDPEDILIALFELYKLGFITIKQMPISPLGQNFEEKDINPDNPHEMLGDLEQFYDLYCQKREYLWKFDAGNRGEPAGIPFGIWFDMTERGRSELNKPDYEEYIVSIQ